MSFQWKMKSFEILIVILLLGVTGTAKAREVTIFVDNWPPYSFKKDDKIVGISTELIELALQKANIKYKLVTYPFKRALITVQNTPGTMLFTVARIPKREELFKWIGPLHPRRVYLYKLKTRADIQINNIVDIKKYRTGVLSGGSIEQFFISNNINKNNYYLISNSEQLLKMLFKQRVDLIPGDPIDLAYQMKKLGYKYSKLEIAYLISDEGGYYMVANKHTSNNILEKIQESLNEILATGAKSRIINKYLQ